MSRRLLGLLAVVALALTACGGPARPAPVRPDDEVATSKPSGKPPRKPRKPRKPQAASKPRPHDGDRPDRPAEIDPGTDPGTADVQEGFAVWYGGSWHGKPTASGERFNKRKLTAAHRKLPMGTRVRVTHTGNGRSVEVRINDRGPYGKDRRRIIDVSEAAARKLDMIDAGVAPIRLEVLSRPNRD